MTADASPMAKRRPLPTCPATARMALLSSMAGMRSTGESAGWRSVVGRLVTSCCTCATTGWGPVMCPATTLTTGSAIAKTARLRSAWRGREGGALR